MWPTTRRLQRRRESDRRGFTLLELLLAVAIMSIAIVPLYMALNAAMESWRRGSAYQEAYQNARGAVDAIARDLDSLAFFPGDPSTRFIASQQYLETPKWLTFNIAVERDGSDLARVLYFTIPDDYSLRRKVVYQDWEGDGHDKKRALFEVDTTSSATVYTVFPLNDDGSITEQLSDVGTWEEFDGASSPPNPSYPEHCLDPRNHTPRKRDGDQVANNIIDLRFSYYYTKDTETEIGGATTSGPDGELDESSLPGERILHFEPATMLDANHPNTGWYSHWQYYPDPDDPDGDVWPPGSDFIRQTPPPASESLPIGLPLAIGIEVTASNDAKGFMTWDTENDGPKPQAVATVSQTIWLTSKWMSP